MPTCLVLKSSNNATVPFIIVGLLISFNGFPYTLNALNFINPIIVGNLETLLFYILKWLRDGDLFQILSDIYYIWLLLTSTV